MKSERTCDVPRSVWEWATDTYDSATCEDIWRVIYLRRIYRSSFRRTVLKAGFLFGTLMIAGPALVNRSTEMAIIVYGLAVALSLYLITGMLKLRRIGTDCVGIYAQDFVKWKALGENLDSLTWAFRKGNPTVTVLVTFEYPDA